MDKYLVENDKGYNYEEKSLVLVIYDIVDDKRRTKLFKFLSGYLAPVQKSCFETLLTKSQLNEIRSKIPYYINENEDNIRIYELSAYGKVYNYGLNVEDNIEDIIII